MLPLWLWAISTDLVHEIRSQAQIFQENSSSGTELEETIATLHQ